MLAWGQSTFHSFMGLFFDFVLLMGILFVGVCVCVHVCFVVVSYCYSHAVDLLSKVSFCSKVTAVGWISFCLSHMMVLHSLAGTIPKPLQGYVSLAVSQFLTNTMKTRHQHSQKRSWGKNQNKRNSHAERRTSTVWTFPT